MFTKRVQGSAGEVWHVGLVVLPSRQGIGVRQRLRRRIKGSEWPNFIDAPLDFLDEIWLLVVLALLAILMLFFGWPLLLLLLDLGWLCIVSLGAVVSFGVLRRPITIRAYSKDQSNTWKVRGFRAALAGRRHIATKLSEDILPKDITL